MRPGSGAVWWGSLMRRPSSTVRGPIERDKIAGLVHDFLGSTQVFASALNNALGEKLLREAARDQLTLAQFKLLKLVALKDTHTLGDVAVFLGESNAAASKAVDKLVRRKLLRRTEGEIDRRTVRLSLTAPSRRLLAAYDARKHSSLAKIFRQSSPAELRKTAELLDHLSAGIVKQHAQPGEICRACGVYFRKKCLVRELARLNCFYFRQKNGRNGRWPSRNHGSKNSSGWSRPAPTLAHREEGEWPR